MPGATVEKTDYDAQGRVTSQRAFGGDVTTTSYVWSSTLETLGMGPTGAATFGGWTETTRYYEASAPTVIVKTSVEKSDMFGRLVEKTDLGSHVFTYAYDRAGRLTSQAVTGETTAYAYLNTGLVASISNPSGSSAYTYDAAGNRLTELTVKGGSTVQNATATYDALGRMASWNDKLAGTTPEATIAWQYDKAGNIRRSNAQYYQLDAQGSLTGTLKTQDHWFLYDSMNRVTRSKGKLVGTTITLGAEGTDFSYNDAGQRVTSTRELSGFVEELHWFVNGQDTGIRVEDDPEPPYGGTRQWVPIQQSGTRTETYTYRNDGQLQAVSVNENGTSRQQAAFVHDDMGRVTSQIDYTKTLGGTVVTAWQRDVTYNAKGQVSSETVNQRQGGDTLTSTVTNNYGTGAAYALGAVLTVTSVVVKNGTDASPPDTLTTNTYQYWDGAVQSTIVHDSDTAASNATWNTTYNYGPSGQLNSVSIVDGRPRTITYTNDMAGQIIRRDEDDNLSAGDPHEIWYRFGGKQLGYVGNNGTLDTDYHQSVANRQLKGPDEGQTGAFRFNSTSSVAHADFSQSVEAINSYGQGSGAGSYTVRAGDTLASVAAQLWGDASLWYKLAEANGMSAGGALIEGQSLNIPQGVMRSAHNAGTFNPYDPLGAIGDTSPTTPQPQKGNKCGVMGQILLVAIAVAVTIATSGALSHLGAVAAGAIGGAAGSAASQVVGLATGIQSNFSWRGVALGAIGGAVGGAFKGVDVLKGGLGKFTTVANDAARGALSNAAIQGVSLATGLQGKFDWAGVAVGAAVSGVGGFAGRRLGIQSFNQNRSFGNHLNTAISGTAGGIAGAAARSVINGTSFGDNLVAVLPDVIGSSVGNMFGYGMSAPRETLVRAGADMNGGNEFLGRFDLGGFIGRAVRGLGRLINWATGGRENLIEIRSAAIRTHSEVAETEQNIFVDGVRYALGAIDDLANRISTRPTVPTLPPYRELIRVQHETPTIAPLSRHVPGHRVINQNLVAPANELVAQVRATTNYAGNVFDLPSRYVTYGLESAAYGLYRAGTGLAGHIGRERAFPTTQGVAVSGHRAIDIARSYEAGVRNLYGGANLEARRFTALVNGERVSGIADDIVEINGVRTAIDAKYVADWSISIRNPESPYGHREWAIRAQDEVVAQARSYAAAFRGGAIYHTNSRELAAHYTAAFERAGIASISFVITPAHE